MKDLILFFDTETTGKADFKAAPDAPHQPRIVQLGMVLSDSAGRELGSVDLIVKPDGFFIPKEASDIHGVTQEAAENCGVPLALALDILEAWMGIAGTKVAHNLAYDDFVVRGELLRLDGCTAELDNTEGFCTMEAMTLECQIPNRWGKFKWPKLQEAYLHAFGKQFDNAHSAIADVRACKDLFFWLKGDKRRELPDL